MRFNESVHIVLAILVVYMMVSALEFSDRTTQA
jgi:hypothetical protein